MEGAVHKNNVVAVAGLDMAADGTVAVKVEIAVG
jgi:hypothetical protein